MIYKSLKDLTDDDLRVRKIAFKVVRDKQLADEMVSIFYLKMMRRFPKTPINMNYIATAIYREFNEQKEKYKYTHLEYEPEDNDEQYNYGNDKRSNELYNDILEDLGKLEYFHRQLFIYVCIEGISTRRLAELTKISRNIIQKSIGDTKRFLKNKYQEQYGKVKQENPNDYNP